MMQQRLGRAFYARDTHVVAKKMLGKLLVRRWRNKYLVGRINEVESYVGENDKACHAAKGRTKRTEVMFGEAGCAYVYLVYGMYCCLNVVTESAGFPAAVLIRGLMTGRIGLVKNKAIKQNTVPHFCVAGCRNCSGDDCGGMLLNGPGKICRAMHISRAQNGEDLTVSDKLWLADDGYAVVADRITTTPRIGVDYAGDDALLPWRYVWREV